MDQDVARALATHVAGAAGSVSTSRALATNTEPAGLPRPPSPPLLSYCERQRARERRRTCPPPSELMRTDSLLGLMQPVTWT